LPDRRSIVAAVNPADDHYEVQALDPAMRARFLVLCVRADRTAWLAWVRRHGVYPGVVKVVLTHEKAFVDVPPRT
jgi:hypothetical protein